MKFPETGGPRDIPQQPGGDAFGGRPGEAQPEIKAVALPFRRGSEATSDQPGITGVAVGRRRRRRVREATPPPEPAAPVAPQGTQLPDIPRHVEEIQIAAADDRAGRQGIWSRYVAGPEGVLTARGEDEANRTPPHQVIPSKERGNPVVNTLVRKPAQEFAGALIEIGSRLPGKRFMGEERAAWYRNLQQANGRPLGEMKRPRGRSFAREAGKSIGKIGS